MMCISYLKTGSPGKEGRANKLPPTTRIRERREETTIHMNCHPPRTFLAEMHPWRSDVCTTRKDYESEWLTRDNAETNPISIKPETVSHVAVLPVSLTLLLFSCTYPGAPSQKVSSFVNTCVPLDNSFLSVRPEFNPGPWSESPSCNTSISCRSGNDTDFPDQWGTWGRQMEKVPTPHVLGSRRPPFLSSIAMELWGCDLPSRKNLPFNCQECSELTASRHRAFRCTPVSEQRSCPSRPLPANAELLGGEVFAQECASDLAETSSDLLDSWRIFLPNPRT